MSAGLTLLYTGGAGRSAGRKVLAALIAACTVCSAMSSSMSRLNCRVMVVMPKALLDDICWRPAISPN
ncbi:hypothetical protein D3C85_1414070 [compost metagenome]